MTWSAQGLIWMCAVGAMKPLRQLKKEMGRLQAAIVWKVSLMFLVSGLKFGSYGTRSRTEHHPTKGSKGGTKTWAEYTLILAAHGGGSQGKASSEEQVCLGVLGDGRAGGRGRFQGSLELESWLVGNVTWWKVRFWRLLRVRFSR